MKTKFYTNINEDADEEDLKFLDIEIKGKIIRYSRYPKIMEEEEEYGHEDVIRFFDYKYDTRYKNVFPKLKLNYYLKIELSGMEDELLIESSIGGKNGYCYLNQFQKFKLNWSFGDTWFQKKENTKWLLGGLMTIITAKIIAFLTK